MTTPTVFERVRANALARRAEGKPAVPVSPFLAGALSADLSQYRKPKAKPASSATPDVSQERQGGGAGHENGANPAHGAAGGSLSSQNGAGGDFRRNARPADALKVRAGLPAVNRAQLMDPEFHKELAEARELQTEREG